MATLDRICISTKKGTVKKPIPEARMIAGHGIDGDAHAGDWHRQVSLLASESIAGVRKVLPDLVDGAFAENFITTGVDWARAVTVGDLVRVGESVVMEVTQIGKECHTNCAIGVATGDCIMPREGVFCRVLEGGLVRPGDTLVHEPVAVRIDDPQEMES